MLFPRRGLFAVLPAGLLAAVSTLGRAFGETTTDLAVTCDAAVAPGSDRGRIGLQAAHRLR
jgi:hypothetical protein